MYVRVTNEHYNRGSRDLGKDPLSLAIVETLGLPSRCVEVFARFVFVYDYHKNLRYVCFLPLEASEFYVEYMTAYRTPKFFSFGFIIGEEEYTGDILKKVIENINEIN